MLAIIAGYGDLPIILANHLQTPVFILGIANNWNPKDFTHFKNAEIGIGDLETGIRILKENHCDELIFAGKVQRTELHAIAKDPLCEKIFQDTLAQGDDYALRSLHKILEEHGFKITAPHILCPELICQHRGSLGKSHPTDSEMRDIIRGQEVLSIISAADIGQAAIIQQGLTLGIEAIEGTNGLIKRIAPLQINHKGAILIKLPKIGQTDILDLPAIGIETIKLAVQCNFGGIAIAKEKTIFIHAQAAIAYADAHQLFIYALEELA